jgi:hypothetical protein
VRHYYLDTSDSFGSEWDWDEISRRLGNSYLLDWGDIGSDFITLGLRTRPWEKARRTPGYELFGYFHYRGFEPDGWKNEYPNPAFSRATEHDNAWMARILSKLEREDIERLVSLGKLSRPEHAFFLTEVLEQRLRRILERYFSRLSPLAEPHLEGPRTLCLLDLARRRNVAPPFEFKYEARQLGPDGKLTRLDVRERGGGSVCAVLPPVAPDGGAADGDPSRYTTVTIENHFAKYPLEVHLYDLGPSRGVRVVGLDRVERTLAEIEARR